MSARTANSAVALMTAILVLIAPHAVRGGAVFSDGTFLDADWTSTELSDTTAGGVATFSATRSLTGGNPDAYRSVASTVPVSGLLSVAHLRDGATWSPATQGPVTRLDFAYDYIVSPPGVDFGDSDRILPLLVQNGSYYAPAFMAFNQSGWHHLAKNNNGASSYVRLAGSGPTLPDLGASGSPIEFGYITRDGMIPSNPTQPRLALIDNWYFAINVPEPTMGLIALVAALLIRRTRRDYAPADADEDQPEA